MTSPARSTLAALLLVAAAAVGADAAAACPGTTTSGVGFTANGMFFGLNKTMKAFGECCSWCEATPRCYAWTFHAPKWSNGFGECSIADAIHRAPNAGSATTSGHKAGPAPAPAPASTSCAKSPDSPKAKAGSKDIVMFLMDDMDLKLGSWGALPKTTRLLSDKGATAKNWFIHTPVCCPSRSELVTGRYFHSIRNPNPGDKGCMHVNVNASLDGEFYGNWYFGPHLQQAGYTVGIFGKHLNNANPMCPPPGVDKWFANGGGNYFSPAFSVASAGDSAPSSASFTNCSYNNGSCYSTSVIANQSLVWIDEVLAQPEAARKPLFAYIAVKAPHIQDGPGWPITLPAPWYADKFPGLKAPRTPNWNASCPHHHWMIRTQPPMTDEQAMRSDMLYRARWQALMSVDDMVEGVVGAFEKAGKADDTYFIFTSDHGYRFGQFRMPQGKWNAYDNDLRIPWVIRGPGIAAGSTFHNPGSNVDTIPTVLGLAGVATPPTMDGRSIAALLKSYADGSSTSTSAATPAWRTELLIEYYGLGNVVRYEHLEDTQNNTFRSLRVVDPDAAEGERNLKLSEFVGWDNWNFTRPADEFELFDLDADEWELNNIYSTAPAALKTRLHASLEKLYRCQGTTCN